MVAKNEHDSPGVHIPPPLIYVVIFLFSILKQRFIPISENLLNGYSIHLAGILLIAVGLIFDLPAFLKFMRTSNTVVTIRSATSLQMTGIYNLSRNPMYFGLLLVYTGLAIIFGNWWPIIFIPILIAIMNIYVIKNEEDYLERAFGQDYISYKNKVRRWI